jgi:hypothetical protein
MTHDFFILKGKTPVPVDLMTWARWFENVTHRTVAKTIVSNTVNVSTVFIGLDHQFGNGPPLIFETMVFGGPHDGDMNRYSTWDEAAAGHAAMVAKVRA